MKRTFPVRNVIACTTGYVGTPLTAWVVSRPVVFKADWSNFATAEEARSSFQPKCNSFPPEEAGHFVSAHCCAFLAAFPMRPAHRFSLHLPTQCGLNRVKVTV